MMDNNSPIAKYEQVLSLIKKDILTRKIGEGGCIGTHKELAERFGVSLITVRKAVEKLVEEDIVIVRQGKGTYVKSSVLVDRLTKLTGVSNIASSANVSADAKVISFQLIDTPTAFPRSIGAAFGKKCAYIERIHYVDGVAIGYARIYISGENGKHVTVDELEKNTIYKLMETKFGIKLGCGMQQISAKKASAEVAQKLGIDVGEAVLSITREAYDEQDRLIEYMELYYCHDQYVFKVELDLSSS